VAQGVGRLQTATSSTGQLVARLDAATGEGVEEARGSWADTMGNRGKKVKEK